MKLDREGEATTNAPLAWLDLTQAEKSKLTWLQGVYKGLDTLQKLWRADASEALMEGYQLTRTVNLNQVQQYCSPEVLVIIADDETRKNFFAFPLYAVLPRIGTAISVRDLLNPTATEDEQTSFGVEDALQLLEARSSDMVDDRRENALKHLRVLKRLYKPLS